MIETGTATIIMTITEIIIKEEMIITVGVALLIDPMVAEEMMAGITIIATTIDLIIKEETIALVEEAISGIITIVLMIADQHTMMTTAEEAEMISAITKGKKIIIFNITL